MDEKWEDRQEQLRMREYTQNLAGGRLLLRWGRGRSDFHLLDRRPQNATHKQGSGAKVLGGPHRGAT